jgi:negative regulator of flagellin synthesis FlgM
METRNINKSQQALTNALGQASVAGGVEKAKKATGTNEATKTEISPKSGDQGVNVELSPQARQMAEARKKAADIARSTPDVREDRVAALKAQIASGTYKPDPGKIADGILREAILDRLSETKEV